jgi:hypothetical protein
MAASSKQGSRRSTPQQLTGEVEGSANQPMAGLDPDALVRAVERLFRGSDRFCDSGSRL